MFRNYLKLPFTPWRVSKSCYLSKLVIPLSASVFMLAIISSIFIAWITVAHPAIKAAIANPVKSLRTE